MSVWAKLRKTCADIARAHLGLQMPIERVGLGLAAKWDIFSRHTSTCVLLNALWLRVKPRIDTVRDSTLQFECAPSVLNSTTYPTFM